MLETALNVTLLERDAGSVRLTSRGQALLSHARQVLRATEEFVEAADGTSPYDGVLKLGVTELIVHTWLRDYLKTLKESYPNLLVELTVDLSITISRELFTRAIDLALQNGVKGPFCSAKSIARVNSSLLMVMDKSTVNSTSKLG